EAKAPAQRFIEKFGRSYTPAVVGAALIAFAVSRDAHLALTLLVIGCPGALVISIPVSIVAGIGRAAQAGILIKGGEHLETTARIDTVAFDKTGTLTTGEFQVADVVPVIDQVSADRVLALAAAVETLSEHPLAGPVVDAAQSRGSAQLEAEGFAQHAGRGVSAQVAGTSVAVGSERLMSELGVEVSPDVARILDRLTGEGKTALLVAAENRVIGVVAMADTLRDDAATGVSRLHRAGVTRLWILTGDSERVASRVATASGISEVKAGRLPEDKLAAVQELQATGLVAMVGDGVNDAPALAAADVGVAFGPGATAVAAETADVAILSGRVEAIADAIEYARATTRNLRQNVVVSIATVGLLLTGVLAGEVHMAGGMLIHQLSVLVVIVNAARLLRLGRRKTKSRTETIMEGSVPRPRDLVV